MDTPLLTNDVTDKPKVYYTTSDYIFWFSAFQRPLRYLSFRFFFTLNVPDESRPETRCVYWSIYLRYLSFRFFFTLNGPDESK
jgi:hypothetical protein